MLTQQQSRAASIIASPALRSRQGKAPVLRMRVLLPPSSTGRRCRTLPAGTLCRHLYAQCMHSCGGTGQSCAWHMQLGTIPFTIAQGSQLVHETTSRAALPQAGHFGSAEEPALRSRADRCFPYQAQSPSFSALHQPTSVTHAVQANAAAEAHSRGPLRAAGAPHHPQLCVTR